MAVLHRFYCIDLLLTIDFHGCEKIKYRSSTFVFAIFPRPKGDHFKDLDELYMMRSAVVQYFCFLAMNATDNASDQQKNAAKNENVIVTLEDKLLHE